MLGTTSAVSAPSAATRAPSCRRSVSNLPRAVCGIYFTFFVWNRPRSMLLLKFAPARVEWSALGWQTDLRTLCRDVNMYPLSSFWFAAAAPCGMGATIKTEGAYRLGEDQECWRYFRSIAFRTMVSLYPPVLFQPVSPRSTCTRRVWKRAPQHRCGLPYRPRPNRSVHAEADVLVSLQALSLLSRCWRCS